MSMTNLGVMHNSGDSVERDESKAFDLFNQAANRGDVRAMRYLGDMLYFGKSVKQDRARFSTVIKLC